MKKKKQIDALSTDESEEKRLTLSRTSSHLIKKKSFEPSSMDSLNSFKGFVGPLTKKERLHKVLRHLQRKRMKSQMKKFCYKCRKQVAEKRLRIKGRFVTKKQAFEILGLTSADLKSNEIIQQLLESNASSDIYQKIQLNSLVESENGTKQIKIRNFQALIDDNYNHNSGKGKIFES